MGLIENKPSNEESSYFLIDNFNIADSRPHILTTMATPIVENEIDSFATIDVENNDNDSSETLNLIDSAYKNIKFKKIKVSYYEI